MPPALGGNYMLPASANGLRLSWFVYRGQGKAVSFDPALFAGHSMRSGFLTSAAKRGASIFKMMDQSRHRSVETLRGYVRDAEIFKEHAGTGLL